MTMIINTSHERAPAVVQRAAARFPFSVCDGVTAENCAACRKVAV